MLDGMKTLMVCSSSWISEDMLEGSEGGSERFWVGRKSAHDGYRGTNSVVMRKQQTVSDLPIKGQTTYGLARIGK